MKLLKLFAWSLPTLLIAGTKAHLLRLWSPALRRVPVKFVIGMPVPGAVSWKRCPRRSETSRPDRAARRAELLVAVSGSGSPELRRALL